MRHLILAVAVLAAPLAAAPVSLADRPAEAVALDTARKPVEVLAASGIKPGDRVLDVMAGNGYYTELLSRVVGPTGRVTALEPPPFLEDPKALANWDALTRRDTNVTLLKAMPADVPFPTGLDVAFFHLTYHDLYWQSDKYKFPRMDPAAFNARLFQAMKKGGSVIVIDHVGVTGLDAREQADKTHRIDPAVVRADFEKAGFRYAGSSPVLQTAGDDPTKLVFDPAVRGKTDRFLYRFTKP
ncbi:class I SAM-dependent methyltransferase [Sandarakinorhabdus sp. DWP1-3-1]|uniref:class I SAM-dependent methyltransferase n=1 Tax=Sandarakinorhabdus sp. DWP1-3-1 TaxID=2804627 RepID=UPI003CE73B55